MSDVSLGVCTWSLVRDDVIRGLQEAASLGISVVQIGFFSDSSQAAANAVIVKDEAAARDIVIHGVFVGFEGEDYGSWAALRATGGMKPDDLFEARVKRVSDAFTFATTVGARSVIIHAGKAPDETSHADFDLLCKRLVPLAREAHEHDLTLLFETGRESGTAMASLVAALGEGAGVNFDPANFVTMGTDEPLNALRALKEHLGAVHLKDAHPPDDGSFLGRPAALGQGEASIPRLINKLRVWRYAGPLLVECSRSMAGKENVSAGLDYVRSMLD